MARADSLSVGSGFDCLAPTLSVVFRLTLDIEPPQVGSPLHTGLITTEVGGNSPRTYRPTQKLCVMGNGSEKAL
jgi:hypothetical protein